MPQAAPQRKFGGAPGVPLVVVNLTPQTVGLAESGNTVQLPGAAKGWRGRSVPAVPSLVGPPSVQAQAIVKAEVSTSNRFIRGAPFEVVYDDRRDCTDGGYRLVSPTDHTDVTRLSGDGQDIDCCTVPTSVKESNLSTLIGWTSISAPSSALSERWCQIVIHRLGW